MRLIFLLVLVVPALSVPSGQVCPKPSGETSSCVCQTKNGVVDLRPVSSKNGSARYSGLQDSNKFQYEYNPCFTFSTTGECTNVYMCQETPSTPPSSYKIADAGTEQMYLDTSGVTDLITVFYTSTNSFGQYREVYVHLECDKEAKDPVVTTTGDSIKILTYEVSFKSCQACPGGCGGGGNVAGVVGLVLIIVFVFSLAAYFVIGAIILRVGFKKTGVEMIPQKDFWFSLPGLIKAGFIFTFQPLINLVRNRGSKGGYTQEL